MKKFLALAVLVLVSSVSTFAQQQPAVEMADTMRTSGKIYVVIATITIVFAGLAIYLLTIDRRLRKIEKDI